MTGGKCGSIYIDRNFHVLLSSRFGDAFDQLPYAQKRPGSIFMSTFEESKCEFESDPDESAFDVGPLNMAVEASAYYDVEEQSVTLS
jgi:hypothetical protein